MHLRYDRGHVLQVAFRKHRLLQIVGVAPIHAVFIGGIADDLLFFHRGDMAGIDPQGNAILLSEMRQDSLFIRCGWILSERPHTAVCVAADEMVRFKLNHRRGDHVQKFLNPNITFHFCGCSFCFLQRDTSCSCLFSGIKNTPDTVISDALTHSSVSYALHENLCGFCLLYLALFFTKYRYVLKQNLQPVNLLLCVIMPTIPLFIF